MSAFFAIAVVLGFTWITLLLHHLQAGLEGE